MVRFKSVFHKTYWLLPVLFMFNWLLGVNLGTPWLDVKALLQSLVFAIIVYLPIFLWHWFGVSGWIDRAFKRFEVALFSTHRIFWTLLIVSVVASLLTTGGIGANIIGSCAIIYLPFLIWRLINPKRRAPANDTETES